MSASAELTGEQREALQDALGQNGRLAAEAAVGAPAQALAAARVDLVERIREGIPERELVPGGEPWLIAGKRYLVPAPAGTGKSLLGLVVAVGVVEAGGTAAILDVENGADEYARRLADRRVFCVATAERWAAGHPLHRVVEEIAGSPADFGAIAPETNGLGGPCAQMLDRALRARPAHRGGGDPPSRAIVVEEAQLDRMIREGRQPRRPPERPGFYTRRVPVHSSAELKAACYSSLRLMVEQERLILPRSAEELIRELLMLRVNLSPTGTERIEASAGHDDLADALMLAMLPARDRRTGRWRAALAGLAEPRRPLSPARPVRLAEPEVETGGGLKVYRRPALQSVVGTEISIPPGAEVAPDPRPTDPRLDPFRESASAALAARKEAANG